MPASDLSCVETIVLPPGHLWERTLHQSAIALARGALHSIPTTYEWIEQAGIHFLVRVLENLNRKEAAKQQKPAASGQSFNPFLPYEDDLFVADLSPTHLCLLNKFNVVDHHLLIITRNFEDQETLLNVRDFEALAACMAEIDGLAFYNAGRDAGASQRHKHLQLVPLPLVPQGSVVPIEAAIAPVLTQGSPPSALTVSMLPYRHALLPLCLDWSASPIELAHALLHRYERLLASLNLSPLPDSDRQRGAYNLLLTRTWMMLVPRSQDAFEGIAVNALGFAGALLVRNADQLQQLKTYTPLTLLTNVAFPMEAERA